MERFVKSVGREFSVNKDFTAWLEEAKDIPMTDLEGEEKKTYERTGKLVRIGRGRPRQFHTRCRFCKYHKIGWARMEEHVRKKHWRGGYSRKNKKGILFVCPVKACSKELGFDERRYKRHVEGLKGH